MGDPRPTHEIELEIYGLELDLKVFKRRQQEMEARIHELEQILGDRQPKEPAPTPKKEEDKDTPQ